MRPCAQGKHGSRPPRSPFRSDSRQAVDPVLGRGRCVDTLPGAHGVHAVDALLLKVPPAHGVHPASEGDARKVPAVQATLLARPAAV